uniref:Sodium/calcium exchanger membrane region domain-containing protein n=1 Tax=Alexandrium andersonii TaxID=327968 RepID=A0A7S2DE34_9DINO
MPGAAAEMALSSGEPHHINHRTSRFVKGTMEHKPANVAGSGLMAILMHPLNVLLVTFPLGILSHMLNWGQICTFWFNFCALVPLAKILGDATEELAAGLKNDMLAGLLNATFGNAVEMVIMLQTLRAGYVDVVKATLLGSVLSNLLLVLGMSFFFGGIMSNGKKKIVIEAPVQHSQRKSIQRLGSQIVQSPEAESYTEFIGEKVQTFSVMSALVNTSMLLLSCLSFSLVTVFASQTTEDGNAVLETVLLPVSRTCSIIIMIAYAAYIFFQLVTHREAMAEDDGGEEGGGDDEEPALSIPTAVLVMLVVTCVVAFSSELLVSSLDEVVEHMGINKHFIGIILLPIVGNACEHASAIRFAIMDKCGLSIGIAVGSSTQMSLFVVPFSVLCGWFIGQDMDLNFGSLNTTVMSISVVVVLSVVVDGTANWLQGYLLMSAYFVVAVLYWHLPN